MKMSNEIGKIAPALVAIAENMTVIKDTEGVHSAKYATLSNTLAVIRPALKEAGLTVIQSMQTDDKAVTCTTRIMHESGEWIDSEATVTAAGLNPQLYGSAISYVRRYGICAALSISNEGEDDDSKRTEIAYTKAEAKEAEAVELRKFQAAILPRLLKFDLEPLQLAFEESGYASEEEDKEAMVCELIKQASSKPKLTTIGKRCKELQSEQDK
jgi:hypothetical protein